MSSLSLHHHALGPDSVKASKAATPWQSGIKGKAGQHLLEGFFTDPVVTELVSTVTGPKLVPKTLEESLLVNTVAKLAALVALLSRKNRVSDNH